MLGQVQRLVSILESLWIEEDLMQRQDRSLEESDGLASFEDVEDQVPDLLVLIPRFLQGDDSSPAQAFESLRDARPGKVCQGRGTVLVVSLRTRLSSLITGIREMGPDQVLPELSNSLLHLESSLYVLKFLFEELEEFSRELRFNVTVLI